MLAGTVVGGIALPVLGGFLGGLIGYSLATSYYRSLVNVLNEAKAAHEERLMIEAECEEAIKAIREYRLEMELVINNYLSEHRTVFNNALEEMSVAYAAGNADGFIASANMITQQLGGTSQFSTQEEFDALMESKDGFVL